MESSTKIILTYSMLAVVMAAAISFLTYQVYMWQPPPDTMAEVLRPWALAILPLAGLSQILQTVFHPLAIRVIRMQRRKECRQGVTAN